MYKVNLLERNLLDYRKGSVSLRHEQFLFFDFWEFAFFLFILYANPKNLSSSVQVVK